MLTPAEVLALVKSVDVVVGTFDKIAGQIKGLFAKRPKEAEAADDRWRYKLKGEGDHLVIKRSSETINVITSEDLKKLPPEYLSLIRTYEENMNRNYRLWQAVYKSKDASQDPLVNAKVDEQLHGLVKNMKQDLTEILDFLPKLGLQLDDHYMHIRHLVETA